MAGHDPEILTLGEADGDAHLVGSLASDDLNVNLLRFTGEDGIEEHANREVDVLIVALNGEGIVTIDGRAHPLAARQALIVSKGTARSIRAGGDQFAYLTCHGQRRGLRPTPTFDTSPFRTDQQ